MQVVSCSALAASASALQQLLHAPYPAAAGQQSAQGDGQPAQGDGQPAQGDGQRVQSDGQAAQDGQHTYAKSLSRAVCILDGPIQVHILALLSLHNGSSMTFGLP